LPDFASIVKADISFTSLYLPFISAISSIEKLKIMEESAVKSEISSKGFSIILNKAIKDWTSSEVKIPVSGTETGIPCARRTEAYVAAKRAQKGYEAKGTLDEKIDDKMLGKESGASIFTTRGKDRYEFALNILEKVQELEDKFGSVEKQNDSMKKEEDELDDLTM
jgi:hypothetical protein